MRRHFGLDAWDDLCTSWSPVSRHTAQKPAELRRHHSLARSPGRCLITCAPNLLALSCTAKHACSLIWAIALRCCWLLLHHIESDDVTRRRTFRTRLKAGQKSLAVGLGKCLSLLNFLGIYAPQQPIGAPYHTGDTIHGRWATCTYRWHTHGRRLLSISLLCFITLLERDHQF